MLRTKLYPYQRKGIKWISQFDGCALLADEMGLGKTIQAIGYWDAHYKANVSKPAVIVCPASLRTNWVQEFRTHVGVTPIVLEGRKATMVAAAKVYIVGVETLGRVTQKTSWAYFLRKLKPWLIVVDEAHKIKNLRAKQTKNLLAFGLKIPHRIAMTGTPVINRPAELWPLMHFVRPQLYPSFMEFAMKHCDPQRKPWGWEFKGAMRLDELHLDLLTHVMIRRLKMDVLHELPPKTRQVVKLSITKRKEYDTAFQDFLSWARKNYRHNITTIAKTQALVKSGYLLRLVSKLKLKPVIEWIKNWLESNPGKKIIVFGRHTEPITEIHKYFVRSVMITGETPMKKRDLIQKQFKQDPQCRLLVGNMEAAGTGWNGTCAVAVAFFEYDWRPAIHKQGEDRINRIGQTEPVVCYYLSAHDTIEDKMARLIQSKQGIANEILDGKKAGDSLTIFDQLMGELL